MLLGERRDTGEIIQIDKMVLARHAAMLGSTGSGKTVMAKSVIEEGCIGRNSCINFGPSRRFGKTGLSNR